MIPNILAKIKTNPDFTNELAAKELADVFAAPTEMSSNVDYLRDAYQFLRVQPELSRALFDELIQRHNTVVKSSGDTSFIPGCCCCGIDPYEPERQLNKDLNALEQYAITSTKSNGGVKPTSLGFLEEVAAYRSEAHARAAPIANILAKKERTGVEVFNRFTSPTPIDQPEADYLYGLLERNECIGEDLFEYAFAGARLASLADRTGADNSPVVSKIKSMFGDVVTTGGGKGGGGGCCCCCCCCCCCGGGC